MARVRVEGLTKRFGDVVAVDGVSFEVGEGEFMAMLGPSGCGKTTTLRCIAGLETPDEGNIYIGDELVNDLPPKDRDVSMMFQSYALYPNKTVYENLAFPLRARKLPESEIKRKVEKVAEILHITPLLNRLPGQLSGGERQRVAMGRAIIRESKAYLLDEPLTNLDAKLRVEMKAELKRLQRELRTTTIYATPDQFEALTVADRIAVMNRGRIIQYDRPDVLYDHPKDLFVAGFIGSPSMNFIDCTFVEKNGRGFLDAGEFVYDVSELKEVIKKYSTSSELILGVRPEHISVSKEKAGKDSIHAEVDVSEPMGHRMIINLKIGRHFLKANVQKIKVNMEERVWVLFDRSKLHIFDKKTEKAII
jgi:multiple sugar transport system ATP-binding protein